VNNNSSLLPIVAVLTFIGISVWWLESRFDSTVAVIVIGGAIGVICFMGGALLTHLTQRTTLEHLNRFNQSDAQVDRYRMQSFKALASGESALQRAQAQLTVLDARRVDRLAQQQSKLLIDTERQKWEVQRGRRQTADAWTWDDDEDANDAWQ
jgi:hypothetical protein